MKTGSTLPDLAQRVDRQTKSRRDFLAAPRQTRIIVDDSKPKLFLEGSDLGFQINSIFHEQVREYAKIPAEYYNRMLTETPELLASNLNTWLSRGEGKRMVRTINDEQEQPLARAYLSDRYRPLDNYGLLEAVLPTLSEAGITIESCELTERRLYLKAVNPRVQGEVKRGEVVQAGVLISNSEVGNGSLSIQPLIFTLRCTNGMVIQDSTMRQSHLGKRQANLENDDIQHLLSDEARQADDHALFLKVRDVTKAALQEALFRQQVDKLRTAAGLEIQSDALDKVVEVTSRRFGLTEDEGNSVLSHLIKGKDLSQWGLCSAITRMAQDSVSYDRSTELERIGGRLIELPKSEWSSIASAN